jgi:hypothetical protein
MRNKRHNSAHDTGSYDMEGGDCAYSTFVENSNICAENSLSAPCCHLESSSTVKKWFFVMCNLYLCV